MRDLAAHANRAWDGTGCPDGPLCVHIDLDGRILDGGTDGAVPDALEHWLPELGARAVSALAAAACTLPDRMVSIETRSRDGTAVVVRLCADDDGRALQCEIDDTGRERQYHARLEQRLVFERLIASLSTELIHAPALHIDAQIESALGRIGRLFDVDRAYLFLFSERRDSISNTHEWVGDGISREAANLQSIPVETFPWLMRELFANRAVHVPVVEALPDDAATERGEFMREGIRSIAVVPFGEPGRPDGFIGFDSVRRQREWPDDMMLGLRLVAQMLSNAFQAREMADRLTRLAFHDPLTGLANRRRLAEHLPVAIEERRRRGGRLAVILIDLDEFKLLNDSYGHAFGDDVLRIAASRLSRLVRPGDTVARLGGDEFVLVLDMGDPEALAAFVSRLFEAMGEPVGLRGLTLCLRISVGIAVSPDDGDDAESLLRQADTAMYAAKLDGKNRHAFFSPGMTEASRESLRLRHDLRLAMERGEIRPHYQPRVSLETGCVVGFEALARWHHPERGVLMPDRFLPLAHQSGVLGAIDLDGVRRAFDDLARWRRIRPDCRVSVNLDAHALHDDALVAEFEALLRGMGGMASCVEIEITETSLMRDIERASRVLGRLRTAAPGLRIAIDDFGIGYSSLAYLGRLPVTTLKIDRGFVADLSGPYRASARSIVVAILGLGRSLGLDIVAEGVETREQMRELQQLGCTEAQGYLFSAALSSTEADSWLGRKCVDVTGLPPVLAPA